MCHYVRKPSRPIIYINKRARHTTLVQKHTPKIALLLTKVRLQELQLALLGVLKLFAAHNTFVSTACHQHCCMQSCIPSTPILPTTRSMPGLPRTIKCLREALTLIIKPRLSALRA
jgi:hypothetical protein